MRIAACIEYDGSAYYGWQRQANPSLPTIQLLVEEAIGRVANHSVECIAAGRTDAGVHATGQIIHFDTVANRAMRDWVLGANTYLPKTIAVRWMHPVPETFHARFSAVARRYQYLIFNSPVRSAIMYRKAATIYQPLDTDRMHQAAQYFIGEKDFTSFRAVGCQSKTPLRHLHHFTIKRQGTWVTCEVQANAFLHHMVRNMVGLLIDIGCGKKPLDCVADVLLQKDRTRASITAPAEGLYLVKVLYEHQ